MLVECGSSLLPDRLVSIWLSCALLSPYNPLLSSVSLLTLLSSLLSVSSQALLPSVSLPSPLFCLSPLSSLLSLSPLLSSYNPPRASRVKRMPYSRPHSRQWGIRQHTLTYMRRSVGREKRRNTQNPAFRPVYQPLTY